MVRPPLIRGRLNVQPIPNLDICVLTADVLTAAGAAIDGNDEAGADGVETLQTR
jgi:hypothetical protein